MKDVQSAPGEATASGSSTKLEIAERAFTLRAEGATARALDPELAIFEAKPKDLTKIRGGLIMVQEIFGVNRHIKNVARRFAEIGFQAWAPAFFDHVKKDVNLGYDAEGMAAGRECVQKLGWEQPLEDVSLIADRLHMILPDGHRNVAIIGYCWGGSIAYLASTRLPEKIHAAVSYYGRQAWDYRNEKPQTPLIMHFGAKDQHIPLNLVEDIRKAQPQVPVYVYDADHGFNCDERGSYDAKAAAEALEKSLAFLKTNGF